MDEVILYYLCILSEEIDMPVRKRIDNVKEVSME